MQPGPTVVLHEQMRQPNEEDEPFRECLARLRRGQGEWADFDLLSTRLLDPTDDITGATMLFATRAHVDHLNAAALNSLCASREIDAVALTAVGGHWGTSGLFSSSSPPTVQGLPKLTHLAIGARVMLVTNLAPDCKLSNGSTGYVLDIVYRSRRDVNVALPVVVLVKFDALGEVVPIQPVTAADPGAGVNRLQVPLVLAYASTIHKAIGLTLDRVVVDIKSIAFMPQTFALAYTAVSRPRSMSGLHILRLSRK